MVDTAAPPRPSALDATFEHEQLELFHDPATGLTGVVAIHSTALGPAMGGARLRRYPGIEAAALDALRLGRAMTLKNSAAGLDLGGGKAVLIDDGRWGDNREARLHAFGDVVERLGGRYVTAEDVGTTTADIDAVGTRTRWVTGRSPETGGMGDPSVDTARTVFGAIGSAVGAKLGADSLSGVRVGVLGTGKVGGALAELLAEAGATVIVADVDHARAQSIAAAHETVSAVPVDGFLGREVEVLAPCALGELIGTEQVGGLHCQIVAGAANNPLIDRATAVALDAAGILYVPDFIANCGGIVHVSAEFTGLDEAAIEAQLSICMKRTGEILAEATASRRLPLDVAVEHALRRVEAARRGD